MRWLDNFFETVHWVCMKVIWTCATLIAILATYDFLTGE